jgi:hypothetical protein
MIADDRLTRLRALIDRLERLPASPESEWMLREARARMVDVETGERPREMRPLAVDPPDEAPRRHRDAAVKRPTKPRSSVSARGDEHAGRPQSSETETLPFGTNGLLWLEDSPSEGDTSPDSDGGDLNSQPWRRGLRG